jgi:hypothetical protein
VGAEDAGRGERCRLMFAFGPHQAAGLRSIIFAGMFAKDRGPSGGFLWIESPRLRYKA